MSGEGGIYKKGVANLEMGGQSRSDYGTVLAVWHYTVKRNVEMYADFHKHGVIYHNSCKAYLRKYWGSAFAVKFSIFHAVVAIFSMGSCLLLMKTA